MALPEKNTNISFTDNARKILEKRYLRRNENGDLGETINEMFDRVATAIAEPDRPYRNTEETRVKFFNLLSSKKFFPNSPTFTGAGTPLGQLAACFVLPIEDDMGKERSGIFNTLRDAALIQQSGGGNGFSFSRLRRRGARISKSNGVATGPVGFLKVYDAAFGEVAQGGVRRGANMAVLKVNHPDIREFIKCKTQEGAIANFNISVAITDVFMEAVKKDDTYDLVDPHTNEVVESPKAREIYNLIVEHAHKNGEPGVLFIDSANKTNPVPHLYSLEATNPCGEQWLGPYENCCLGSINLNEHVDAEGKMDWGSLKNTVILSTHFLDNVVSANNYIPTVPELREAAESVRRIGLGIMGLADVMYSSGIRYGSEEGQEFAAQLMEFVRFYSMKTSVELAQERGAFRKISGSIYDPQDLKWSPPVPLKPFKRDFGRPTIDWEEIVRGIKSYGIRNGAQTTVAPTGTISTVAGIEGYGCEPAFALAYYRNVYQAAGDQNKMTLTYVSPLFQKALDKWGFELSEKERIVEEVINKGSCQKVEGLPKEIKDVFVVSSDISPEEHILMQASIQAFVDNSISKTCNFPEGATKEDVSKVYMMGWELGCKGLTVYVTGSRKEVVLETKESKESKEKKEVVTAEVIHDTGRAYKVSGSTYKVQTPQGKAFITINRDEASKPIDIFINVGKAGSDVAALSEALGRLMSCWLASSGGEMRVVKEIVSQLVGIGGSRSVGFGKNRVSSVPDAAAKVLADEFGISVKHNGSNVIENEKPEISVFSHMDMCPECGNYSLVQEEGCMKCYDCGYSAC
jgi:ribonucleoside-diphosphate reductase alpha chain